MIATASKDGTVNLWDLNGQRLTPLQGVLSQIRHDARVWSVDFNPANDQLLATASEGGTIKLWDIDGQLHNTLSGHTKGVISASFSPDGQFLVSAGRDNNLILWNLAWYSSDRLEILVEEGCNLVKGYLENNRDIKKIDRDRPDSGKLEPLCRDIQSQ